MPRYRVLRVSGEVLVEAPTAKEAVTLSEVLPFETPSARRVAIARDAVEATVRSALHSDEGRTEPPLKPSAAPPEPEVLSARGRGGACGRRQPA